MRNNSTLTIALTNTNQTLDQANISQTQKEIARKKVFLLKSYLEMAAQFNCEAKVAEVLLNASGIEVTDEEVWTKIAEGDIVEAYDQNGHQLYCNSLFIKTTTYEIEEFLLHDSFELFSRPQISLDQVRKAAVKALSETDRVVDVKVEPYVIQEKFSKAKKKFTISHKFMCGLRSKETGDKIGFLSTIKVKPVSDNLSVFTRN